jgi:two-component system, NtrC family, nitrogen regulation sensor histidine kinase NtrY
MGSEPRPPRLTHERHVTLLAAIAAIPAIIVALVLLWSGDFSSKVQWTLTALVVGSWLAFAIALHERVVRPLQTLSNMIAALHEQDYSLRARRRSADDALGLAMLELNTLGQQLREQRLGVLEATALLRRVMEEIDVAIFAFDADGRLRLVNRAGERLLGRTGEQLQGESAETLGLATALGSGGDTLRILEREFPGGRGKWEVRRSTFRQGGLPLQLLVLADVSQTLRDEERQAWQRLVRVLGHEINNSLAPIKSVAGSLTELLTRRPRPSDADDDLARGLQVIEGRAEGLSRFLGAYARLARLPSPKRRPLDVEAWVRRVAALETRLPVAVRSGPAVSIDADGDQLDQLLINLVGNAVDASMESHKQGGEVTIGWSTPNGAVEVWVQDDGPGVPATGNLFVPFFTTKPQGTGIGLALSRQIAEAHGGTVSLKNRADGPGCEARLRLPR